MYKILHIPSSTYLKMHRNPLKKLVHISDYEIILNTFLNKIWSEHELRHVSDEVKEFFILKLPTIELANIYLKVFIEGIKESVYFSSEEICCYDDISYYEIVKEE